MKPEDATDAGMPPVQRPVRPLACPFCGRLPDIDDGDTLYPSGTGWKLDDGFRHYVNFREVPADQWCYLMNCTESSGGCGAEMSGDSAAEAVSKWNQRPNV